MRNLLRFCGRLGVEYGEVDALRDRDTGRLFVVDCNNTPDGPPNGINKAVGKIAVDTISEAFWKEFLT
jgi:hypothetical protein